MKTELVIARFFLCIVNKNVSQSREAAKGFTE